MTTGELTWSPAGLVAVRHLYLDANIFGRMLHVGVALHVAVERIGKVVVERSDQAGGVAAPADTGDGSAAGIDLGEASQERMGEDHVGDGMVGPIVACLRRADRIELVLVFLPRPTIGYPDDSVFLLASRVGPAAG